MRQLSFVLPSLKMDMLLNPDHYQVYSFKWPISNIVNCTNKELLHFAWNIKAKELHFPSLRAFFVSFCFLVIWLFVFITDSEHCKMHQIHKLEIRWLTEVPNVQRQSWPTSFLPWLWNIHRSETNWLDWDNQAVSQLRPRAQQWTMANRWQKQVRLHCSYLHSSQPATGQHDHIGVECM